MLEAFYNLCDDLIVETLARVPVNSLLRAKAECKSWYSTIKTPSFINKQLEYSSSIDENHVILMKHSTNNCLDFDVSSNNTHVSFLSDKKDATIASRGGLVPCSFFDDKKVDVTRFYGPCNGIVCVLGKTNNWCTQGDYIALWNPSTNEVKRLPLSTDPRTSNSVRGRVDVGVGFGYDPKSKDYKVVRILDLKTSYHDEVFDRVIEVYNLSTDRWRTIDHVVNMPTDIKITSTMSTLYMNGFYYWWCHVGTNIGGDTETYIYNNYKGNGNSILSFDFTNEVFNTIPSPPNLEIPTVYSIINYKDSVAILADDSKTCKWPQQCTAIWVLNKHDSENKVTWSKTIQFPYKVLGVFKNDSVLIQDFIDCTTWKRFPMVLCDSSFQPREPLKAYDAPVEDVGRFQCVNYVQSLVSLQGY